MRTQVDNYRRRVESAGQATMTQTVKDGEPCANKTERLQQRLDQGKREPRRERKKYRMMTSKRTERKKETTEYNPNWGS